MLYDILIRFAMSEKRLMLIEMFFTRHSLVKFVHLNILCLSDSHRYLVLP
jgi:hypothetical protein